MATYSNTLRSGLPRVPGGEPWPSGGVIASQRPAEDAPVEDRSEAVPAGTAAAEASGPTEPAVQPEAGPAESTSSTAAPAAHAAVETAAGSEVETKKVPLRRGLPRTPGGEPWPPEGVGVITVSSAGASAAVHDAPVSATPAEAGAEAVPETATGESPQAEPTATSAPEAGRATAAGTSAADAPADAVTTTSAAPSQGGSTAGAREIIGESETPLRRGLPRVAGGEPWPPAGFAPLFAPTASAAGDEQAAPVASESSVQPEPDTAAEASTEAQSSVPQPEEAAPAATAASAGPATQKPTAEPASAASAAAEPTAVEPAAAKPDEGKAAAPGTQKPAAAKPAASTPAAAKPAASAAQKPAAAKPAKAREPIMVGSKSLGQWAKLVGLWLGGLIVAAGIIVLAARGVTTLPGVPEFLDRYPGEYHLPDFVEPGFPAWARWTHFLNIFFMVLIIRSGLQVRHQQKPPAYYTPKRGGKKVSINLWLHTSLDVLWLANGVVFVVLLFVSGHWARIVPTSWEVFPNAVSALLQYMTLEWPAENAWVNYNSLQQLMYFIVVFIAAPLAAITGVRMSEWWPKEATTLNRIYPAPLARAIHFPTMLFFVAFILIHVFLVVATGFLQNLNHMFAGRHEVSWVGFGWFVASLAVIVGAWFAARPMLLAPIASLFGRVSTR